MIFFILVLLLLLFGVLFVFNILELCINQAGDAIVCLWQKQAEL